MKYCSCQISSPSNPLRSTNGGSCPSLRCLKSCTQTCFLSAVSWPPSSIVMRFTRNCFEWCLFAMCDWVNYIHIYPFMIFADDYDPFNHSFTCFSLFLLPFDVRTAQSYFHSIGWMEHAIPASQCMRRVCGDALLEHQMPLRNRQRYS